MWNGFNPQTGHVEVTDVDRLPVEPHLAVLVNESMAYDSGYGNGQSDSTMKYVSYLAFQSKEELEAWIIANHTRKTFRVISSTPVPVQLKASFSLEGL